MPKTRFVLLDGLRGVVAAAIVVHHITQHSYGHREFFASAAIGVELFFCLGGFVTAHSYHDRLLAGMSFRDYAVKRLLRLYPMYLAGLLFGVAAMALLKLKGLAQYSWDSLGAAFALNALYLPYFGTDTYQVFVDAMPGVIFPFNGPAWSLFFGLLANFAYAATIRLSRWMPAVLAVVSAAGLYEATRRMGEAPGWGTENFIGGFPRVFYSFFTGVVIYQWRDRLAFLPRLAPGTLLLLVVAMLIMPRFAAHKVYWFACALVVVPLLVALGSRALVAETSPWQSACAYSAQISYPLYCVHFPLLMIAGAYLSSADNLVWLVIGFTLASIALAAVSLRYIERPLRSLIARRARKQAS